MSGFFRNSTQSTGLQQAIDRVTESNQAEADWALIMQLCDYVSSKEESAKEAMKTIRKRLQTSSSIGNWRSISHTLTLLEALTKNCGKIFHIQIAHRDFLKEMKGVIGPKNNPPLPIQERVLGMIQTWSMAFHHDPDLKTVEQFYQECKQQGLQFPPPESESAIKAAVPATGTIDRPLQYTRSMSQTTGDSTQRQMRTGSDGSSYATGYPQARQQMMSPEQVAKLRSELDVVQTNAQVFGEMLVTLQPGQENPQDYELLMELHRTCKQMQNRIVELLSQVSIDDITVDLLRYNDEFNNSFKIFDNYIQERERRFNSSTQRPVVNRPASSTTHLPPKTNISPLRNPENEPSLIQFDDEPTTLSSGIHNLNLSSGSASAVSKTNPPASRPGTTTRTASNQPDPERDAREMEQWLKIQGDDSDTEEPTRREGGTSAAFNSFLEKRASTIPDESTTEQLYPNMQPISNRIDPNARM